MKSVLISFLVFLSLPSLAEEITDALSNNVAVYKLRSILEKQQKLIEEFEKSKQAEGEQAEEPQLDPAELDEMLEVFLNIASSNPNLVYQFNLAVTQHLQGQFNAAKKAYDLLLKQTQGDLRFYVLFNRAIVEAQLKNQDKALDFYQQSLELRPDSKEVKTNIELLLQDNQGKGEGDNKDQQKDPNNDDKNKDNKDGKGDQKDDKNKKGDPKPNEGKDKKPKKPKSLSEKEIQKILKELKRQEQKIRMKDMKKNIKEMPREKDW